ncbi:hypothetical protein KQ305_11345 [Synechococcus sp. CS-1332]|nr:hypothetical protein [Synechococcus sp. CS-1332]
MSVRAINAWLDCIVLMGGWRDGSMGFAFAMLKCPYFVQIACRFRELEQPQPLQG